MLARKEQLGCYNYTKGVSDPLVLDDMLERDLLIKRIENCVCGTCHKCQRCLKWTQLPSCMQEGSNIPRKRWWISHREVSGRGTDWQEIPLGQIYNSINWTHMSMHATYGGIYISTFAQVEVCVGFLRFPRHESPTIAQLRVTAFAPISTDWTAADSETWKICWFNPAFLAEDGCSQFFRVDYAEETLATLSFRPGQVVLRCVWQTPCVQRRK
jgi:hypothetical protein